MCDGVELWSNDIVLLKLAESIPDDLKQRIRPVDLPIANDYTFPADGQDCFFQGWGCTQGGGYYSVASWSIDTCNPCIYQQTLSYEVYQTFALSEVA